MSKRKREIIYLDDVSSTMRAGASSIKSSETLKRIFKVAGGNLLGNVAVILSNRLTAGSTPTLQYGAGTISSGLVTIASLGLNHNDIGAGSGLVTAGQLINTCSFLLTGKSINQHLESRS